MRIIAIITALMLAISARALPEHPRLFLLKGEEAKLMANIKADERWTKVHEAVIGESEAMLTEDNVVFKLNARKEMHHKGCEAVRRMLFLSYSWRMTGDRRFLDKAVSQAEDICRLSSWNPYHFLDVAEITLAASIAYDWLYDDISPSLRNMVQESIVEKALETSEHGGAGNPLYNLRWMDMTSNWSQICHGSMAIAALAVKGDIGDDAICERIIERSVDKMSIPMEAEYRPDGAYSQGIGYWGYGTALNVMFLDAMEKCLGPESVASLEAIPGFMSTGKYFSQLLTNTLQSFSFSDNSTGDNLPEHCIFWFYAKTHDATLLYPQKAMIDRWVDDPAFVSGAYSRHDPLMLIWGAGTGDGPCADFASAKQPEGLFYIARGLNPLCTMRSGWGEEDIWLGFKAGNPSCPHGHMDVGEFMLEWGGIRWAEDLGSDSYGAFTSLKMGSLFNMQKESMRWNELLRYNNFSHNTLTVNGAFQNLETKAEFTEFRDNPEAMYAVADLHDTYAGQLDMARRRVSLLGGNTVVIEDTLKASPYTSASVVWNMTTMAEGFSYDKAKGIVTLEGRNSKGEIKVLKMKLSLADKGVSPGGIKVSRIPVSDEFHYPKLEKPAPGCWFIRIKYNIKKGSTQIMKVEMTKENQQ